MKKKDVLVIFKTHLDIGFTDYSENIVRNYLDKFIPNAIKVGYELKDTDTPFIWTTGSWLIHRALKEDTTGIVDRAVRDGVLNWHSLPFTTHTELMNKSLFEMGLDISDELDARFGKKTVAAKMTDVPGHTLGMIPLMKKHGTEFLHLGINPATPVPPVPPLFKWKNGDDCITVMYQGEYGEAQEFDDFIVYFAHTGDNQGPQSKEVITDTYAEIAKQFPGCNLKAATLNDVAERVANMDNIPIFDKEIGDTWIHGAGTDPQKVSRFRRLLRHIEENDIKNPDLYDNLLVVPEHTWGMNVMIYFHDTENYTYKQMETQTEARKKIEASWAEQRAYVSAAEKVLGLEPDYDTSMPDLTDFEPMTDFELSDIELSWQIFDNNDYKRYKEDYLRLNPDEVEWVMWDYTKPGLPDYSGGIYTAKPTAAYKKGNTKVYRLEFDEEAVNEYGLPYFMLTTDGENTEIKQFCKKPSRQPQACWLKFRGLGEDWEINKLGEWINPENIVGSPLIAAVDKGIRNSRALIETYDAPLVAPYGRKLLHYNEKNSERDMYFNLYNNIWNTNFPMWYSDDAVFRFKITKF